MKFLMSRFGGHSVTIGKGKSSDLNLPEDQSLDHMLDHYAQEIIPNYFIISSYDAKPEWMGSLKWQDFPKKPVKIGTLEHKFNEVFLQYDVSATTDIYITYHHWSNVYAIIIKTHKYGLEDVVHQYTESFDYVLQVFIRRPGIENAKLNAKELERILLILFYKMNLVYEDDIEAFTPSKTSLGKLISEDFYKSLPTTLVNVDSDDKLIQLLKQESNHI
ncbi:hypothetical protein [Polaribacter marinivivus]|uniref:hypothetical protein n=1 Tax=Polaribacter marinivivus TaxID=1524260 RepID=UPI003D349A4A